MTHDSRGERENRGARPEGDLPEPSTMFKPRYKGYPRNICVSCCRDAKIPTTSDNVRQKLFRLCHSGCFSLPLFLSFGRWFVRSPPTYISLDDRLASPSSVYCLVLLVGPRSMSPAIERCPCVFLKNFGRHAKMLPPPRTWNAKKSRSIPLRRGSGEQLFSKEGGGGVWKTDRRIDNLFSDIFGYHIECHDGKRSAGGFDKTGGGCGGWRTKRGENSEEGWWA